MYKKPHYIIRTEIILSELWVSNISNNFRNILSKNKKHITSRRAVISYEKER